MAVGKANRSGQANYWFNWKRDSKTVEPSEEDIIKAYVKYVNDPSNKGNQPFKFYDKKKYIYHSLFFRFIIFYSVRDAFISGLCARPG